MEIVPLAFEIVVRLFGSLVHILSYDRCDRFFGVWFVTALHSKHTVEVTSANEINQTAHKMIKNQNTISYRKMYWLAWMCVVAVLMMIFHRICVALKVTAVHILCTCVLIGQKCHSMGQRMRHWNERSQETERMKTVHRDKINLYRWIKFICWLWVISPI